MSRSNSRTLYGTTEWFRIEKGIQQGCLLSPCLFNQYTEHITRNVGLDELPAGIKIGRRNIDNFRYADDTTLMAESKEELKNLLMKVKAAWEAPALSSSGPWAPSSDPAQEGPASGELQAIAP